VIDKKGIVRKIYPMAQAATHPDEVLKYIKESLEEKK
jgi:peroxiredoxin